MLNKLLTYCVFLSFLCATLLCLIVSDSLGGSKGKVVLASLDWEPYIGQQLENKGYIAEIVVEAYKRSGYEVEIKFWPWARSVKMAKAGVVDGYFPEYQNAELVNDFYISSSFPGGPLGFFKRKDSHITYETLLDLRPYTIGIVRDYVNTKDFDAADYLKKEAVTDDVKNFKKLLLGRVDLVVADKFVGEYMLREKMNEDISQIEFMYPILEEKELFLCISRASANAEIKLTAFERGFAEMKQDGSLLYILHKHGF